MSEKKMCTKRADALTGSNEKIEFKALEHHLQGVYRRGHYLAADLYALFRRIILNGDEEALKKAIWQDPPIWDFWDIYETVSIAVKMDQMGRISPFNKAGNNAEAESSKKRKTPPPAATPSPPPAMMKEVSLDKYGEPSLEDADLLTNLKSPKNAEFKFQFNDFEEWLNAL